MDKLDLIKKEAKATERKLKKLFKETYDNVYKENISNGLGEYNKFIEFHTQETDDMYDDPVKIERNGVCVWISNCWINSNVIPEGVRVVDNRFPVKACSYWYSPYHYMTNISVDELYEKSETEKILYTDFDVKVSIIRRNVIPNFKSYQWCHKLSEPEYVFYLMRKRNDPVIEKKIDELTAKIRMFINQKTKAPQEMIDEQRKLYDSLYCWHECVHDDKLDRMFTKARKYFNDWY